MLGSLVAPFIICLCIQVVSVLLSIGKGVLTNISKFLTLFNLIYFFYLIYSIGVDTTSPFVAFEAETYPFTIFLLILSITVLLFDLSNPESNDKLSNKTQIPLLGLMPIIGTFAMAAVRIELLYFAWMMVIIVAVIILSYQNQKDSKAASISVFIKSFFMINIFILSIVLFVASTQSLDMSYFAISNHSYAFLFFGVFLLMGMFWMGIFPFNSWCMNMTFIGGAHQATMLILWVIAPFVLRFTVFMSKQLPYLNYDYQAALVSLISFFSTVSIIYFGILSMKVKGLRELVLCIFLASNSTVLLYTVLDPIYSNQTNLLFLFIYNVLITSVLIILISYYEGEIKKIVDLKGLIRKKPILSVGLIYLFITAMGMPVGGLFFSRVIFIKDLLGENMFIETALILLGLLFLSYGILRPLVMIIKSEEKSPVKYKISYNLLNFHHFAFGVIFIVGAFIFGIMPELLLKNI